jgi:thiosulfate/3-mercaptopyruvate sulfurtransferase
LAWTSAAALQVSGPLVETGWLADHEGEVVVLDVREDAASFLGTPPAPGKKVSLNRLTGHLPGAVSVPWKKIVAKGSEEGATLKAMLPSAEAFTEFMQASGVDRESAVVIAGRGATAKDQAFATRLYFTLKYFGHDNVALLNGGTAQWANEGRHLSYTKVSAKQGDFVVTDTREHLIADTQEFERAIASGDVQLVDCRTEDFYFGLSFKRKFVSPEHKGHLSGAQTLPFVLLADNAGPAKLFSAQEMHDVATLKGVDLDAPTIAYCNTGVTASLGWFALHEILGTEETRLYDGSMHAWSSLKPSDAVISLAQAVKEGITDEPDRPVPVIESGVQGAVVRPPPSLQTLVDERRDAMHHRRNAYVDSISGSRLFQPEWISARQQVVDGYRDSLRAAHRQHTDAVRFYQDAMRDAYAPWSRSYRDWSEIRHFVSQMEQLDRQELYDGLRFAHTYAPW